MTGILIWGLSIISGTTTLRSGSPYLAVGSLDAESWKKLHLLAIVIIAEVYT